LSKRGARQRDARRLYLALSVRSVRQVSRAARRHPGDRFGLIGYWIERMDAVFASPIGKTVPLEHKPSDYFRRQCWISGDPDERAVAGVIPFVGEDRFFWASDFPHADHPPDYVPNLARLVEMLPQSARPKILGSNVRTCYGLTGQ